MKKTTNNYEQPEIEIIEIAVEKGFGGSPIEETPGSEIETPGGDIWT